MKNKFGFGLICFYEASIGGHGSAEVSKSLYECLPKKNCRLFEIKKRKIFIYLEKYKFNLPENFYKLFYVNIIAIKLAKFIKKYDKKIVIIEGASWIGYTFILLKIIKLFLPEIILIYHSHNIEYDVRKKRNTIFISFITKIIEKIVFREVNFSTVVSEQDQKRIKKLCFPKWN